MKCKDCKHWHGDATSVASSSRMKFCHGLTQVQEPLEELDDFSWVYAADSAMPETVATDYGLVEPRFITGPDFGCVKFEERANDVS